MRWSPALSWVAPKGSCRRPSAHRTTSPAVTNMINTRTTISNNLGLHARASAKLPKLAGSFPCDVFIRRGERRINAKSIMGVMMLAAGQGTEVEIETSGEREQEA